MKLRNKKTGKVFDAIVREKSNGNGEYSIIVCNIRAIRSARSLSSILGEYDSLAKLCEEWEDYKPTEPLIKDPKIRIEITDELVDLVEEFKHYGTDATARHLAAYVCEELDKEEQE